MKKLVIGILVASATTGLLAAVNTWTGGARDHEWSSGGNWSRGVAPGVTDDVVFNNSEGLYVHCATKSGVLTTLYCGSITCSGASVALDPTTYFYFYGAPTCSVFVASGATLSISNVVASYGGDDAVFVKNGPGEFLHAKHFGASTTCFGRLIVKEGVFHSVSQGYSAKVVDSVRVCSGATYWIKGYSCVTGNPKLYLEEGSTLHLNGGWGSADFAGINGSGRVIDESGSRSILTLNLPSAKGTHAFYGVVSSAVDVVISPTGGGVQKIGSTNAFQFARSVTGSKALEFEGGVGGAYVIGPYKCDSGYPLKLEDSDGNPVAVCAQVCGGSLTDSTTFRTSGSGDFYSRSGDLTLIGSAIGNTGTLGVLSGSLTLGNGVAAEDFDFSKITVLDLRSSGLMVNNVTPFSFGGRLLGGGDVRINGGGTLGEVSKTAGKVLIGDDSIISNGVSHLSDEGFTWTTENVELRLRDGLWGSKWSANSKTCAGVVERLPTLDGFTLKAHAPGSVLKLEGGELHLFGYDNAGVSRLELSGGTLDLYSIYQPDSYSTAENPGVIYFNGGRLLASLKDSCQYEASPFADSNSLEVRVGAAGGAIGASVLSVRYGAYLKIKRPILSGVSEGCDGGVVISGFPICQTYYPFCLTGPVTLSGGCVEIPSAAQLPESAGFFGSGDLNLSNTAMTLAGRQQSDTLILGGEGKTVRFNGGVFVRARVGNSDAYQDVRFSGLMRGEGGALFLGDAGFALDGSRSTIKVAGGVETSASGRVTEPVFSLWRDGSWYADFTGYDNGNGFVRFNGYIDDNFEDGAGKTVRLTKNATIGSGTETSVEALSVHTPNTVLTVAENARLHIGNGKDPACVILNFAAIKGLGTLDFGTAEGLLAATGYSETEGCRVSCSLDGSAGLSLVAFPDPDLGYKNRIILSGANTYSGATRVNAVRVSAENASCFSTGDVYVGGGERCGGRVCFASKGAVWNNGFHIAGWGVHDNQYNERCHNGAFEFVADGTVAGTVEIESLARVNAHDKDVRGTISGVVSGDRLEVYDSPGVIALTGHNVYTGGTSVVCGSLAVTYDDSLGTGNVSLDNGTLRFENDDVVEFSKKVFGKGMVQLVGSAPVNFEGDVSELDADLDLCGTRQVFEAIPPFTVITNTATTRACIAFAENLGTVKWNPGIVLADLFKLDVGSGSVLDLCGATINVYRLEAGARDRIVNGTVIEKKPLAGMIMVVR